MIKKLNFLFFFCLITFSYLYAESYSIRVLNQSQTELLIEATFQKPELIVTRQEDNVTSSVLSIDGLLQSNEPGKPKLPFLVEQFSLAGEKVEFKIEEINVENLKIENYSISGIDKNAVISDNMRSPVSVDYQGLFREMPIFALKIFPVQILDKNNSASYVKKIRIRIWVAESGTSRNYKSAVKSGKERKILGEMLLNGNNLNYSKLSPSQSPSQPLSLTTGERYKTGRFKIMVKEDGLYQITYQDLVDAGMDLSSVNPKKLRLFNKGQEIAIYFKGSSDLSFDSGDYFEFFGEKNIKTFLNKNIDMYQDPFTDVNVYWLENSSSNGLRMVEESGALVISNPAHYTVPIFFKETIHFEEDLVSHKFGENGSKENSPSHELDLWFFDKGITAIGSKSYNAYLPHPWNETGLANSVFVKAMLRGLSFKGTTTNIGLIHKAEIWLNNEKIGESANNWKDQNLCIIENTGGVGLAQSDIDHGNNTLRIQMDQVSNNYGSVTDATLLNWFEISYLRSYRADNNYIVFRKQEGLGSNYNFQFEVDGFTRSDIELYKKGVSKIVNNRIDWYKKPNSNYSSYRISFQDEIFYSGIEYIALTKNQKKKPLSIAPDEPWLPAALTDVSLLDTQNKAEYLIITNEVLFDNVLSLKQYHQQKGLSVEVVKVQDIYDEFNFGIKSPLAIKDFLEYAYKNWDQSSPLYYVNLVGAASENYKTQSASKPDLVPTMMFQTREFGASGSDFLYTLVSGDDTDFIPDLVIGRIPAKTNAEFLNYYDKLVNYELPTNTGSWTNRSLMISGNDASTKELDFYPHAFRLQNQRIINYKIPGPYFSRKLNTIKDDSITIDPNFGGTTDLIDYWDDGLVFVNFLGHGGSGIWADVDLFNRNDIDKLNNGYHLPFVSSLTCFTGAFESKSLSGIAEKLITVANKGAIGVYASTGLGWVHNDFAIGWPLAENLFEKRLSIGESVLLSKIYYLGNSIYVHESGFQSTPGYSDLRKSMVNQYNLLGEPLTYLPVPHDDITINMNKSYFNVGDSLNLSIITPFSSGEILVELANEQGEPLDNDYGIISGSSNQFSFVIPEDLNEQVGYLKVYATDESKDSHGFTRVAVKRSLLDSLVVSPENPQVGDSVFLKVYLHSEVPIESVIIKSLYFSSSGSKKNVILEKVNDTLFTTANGLGPYDKMGTWYFTLKITDTSGVVTEYHQQKFVVNDPRPDLSIAENSFQFNGVETIDLVVNIENNSNLSLSGVDIGFFYNNYSLSAVPFYSVQENFNPNENKFLEFAVDTSLLNFGKKFIVVVDYNRLLNERDEKNNIDSSLVYGSFLLVHATTGTIDTIYIENISHFYFPPNSLSNSSTVNYSISHNNDLFFLENQPGLHHIPFKSRSDSAFVHLQMNNNESRIISPVYLNFKVDSTISQDSLHHIGVYRFAYDLKQWVRVSNDSDKNITDYNLIVKTNILGDFALFYVKDEDCPVIEVTINGRALRDNMLVPTTPELAFVLQDENGINLSQGFLATLDNDTIPRTEMNMPDSIKNANAISILTSPKLGIGEHKLVVEAMDANGNKTIKIINFTTSGKFDVIIYGNYPNPFTDETYISYYIDSGDLLKEFTVKIYTVSGRMIKKIDTSDPRYREPDYYEVYWDGRDDDDNIVANGVYFAVVYAKSRDGDEVEYRLKLAKLK